MKKVLVVLSVSAVLVLLCASAALAQKLVQPLRPARCPQPADHRWWGRLPGWPP